MRASLNQLCYVGTGIAKGGNFGSHFFHGISVPYASVVCTLSAAVDCSSLAALALASRKQHQRDSILGYFGNILKLIYSFNETALLFRFVATPTPTLTPTPGS